jgi:hypothetical protein
MINAELRGVVELTIIRKSLAELVFNSACKLLFLS